MREHFYPYLKGSRQFSIAYDAIANGIDLPLLLTEKTQVFSSKGELRRLIQGGGLSLNKKRIDDPDLSIKADILLNNKYLLVQKGKKNYFLIQLNNIKHG
jgi:tyrosyl-tRNA synthetase